jgi:hypothetical protein
VCFSVVGDKPPQRRASVCSLDSGTSLSFLSSNGTRSSDNKIKRNQEITESKRSLGTRSTEV